MMENNIKKVYNTQIEQSNISKGRISFELMLKRGNKGFNLYSNSPLNKTDIDTTNNLINPSLAKKRKISFIDEKDKTKSIKEVIEIQSYKQYNVEIINEDKNKGCECKIF
jgi:hypothetical protein